MHYYLIKANEWNEEVVDMETYHYVVSGSSYGEAVDKVAAQTGNLLCEILSVRELEDWNGLLCVEESVYTSLYEGR